jgi:hypothetical protein
MVLKDFSEEKFDDGNELKNMAKRNAYLDILNEERILLSITHVRSMDEEEAFNIIKEHGIFSKDIVEYAQGKKLKTNIYPL